MASTAMPRIGVFRRLWGSYLNVLQAHPIKTKMMTSGTLYIIGDNIAQFGIEGKTIGPPRDGREQYDPIRTARLTIYGGLIFAPLAHHWLAALARLQLKSSLTTFVSRLAIDSFVWSPFVCALFPSSLGLMEGKSLAEVERKVKHSWFPTWQKAVAVFGPTQVINLTLVPAQHRLLVLQSVGLCWNIFLSYQNNLNNKRLAKAEIALLNAETAHEKKEAVQEIEKLELKKKELLEKESGAAAVATRMSWS